METALVLEVIEVAPVSGRLAECIVKCLSGSVRVGDHLCLPVMGSDRFEVLEIHYFQQLVDELETNFGGQLLVAGESIDSLQPGRMLTLCPGDA